MRKVFGILASLALVAILPASAQKDSCQLNAGSLEQAVISCMAHEPFLMLQIAQHFQDPSSMENLDFVCNNQDAMVKMLVCLEGKIEKCMPQGGDILKEMLPDEQHMAKGVHYLCQNKKLLTENCMSEAESKSYMQCYMGQLQRVVSTAALTSKTGIKSALCSIIAADKYCLQQHHGTCSDDFVKEAFQLLEMFFNTDKCPASALTMKDLKGQLKPGLGSLLLHGAPLPLHFKSENGRKYN